MRGGVNRLEATMYAPNQRAVGKGRWAALTSAPARTGADRSRWTEAGRAFRLGPIEALPGPARCSRSAHQCEFNGLKRSSSCRRATADSGGNAPSNIGLRPRPPSISFSSWKASRMSRISCRASASCWPSRITRREGSLANCPVDRCCRHRYDAPVTAA